jgi:hypothetical protein
MSAGIHILCMRDQLLSFGFLNTSIMMVSWLEVHLSSWDTTKLAELDGASPSR